MGDGVVPVLVEVGKVEGVRYGARCGRGKMMRRRGASVGRKRIKQYRKLDEDGPEGRCMWG